MNPDLPDYSRSRAILVGTSVYQDKGFLPLPAAANSLKGLKEILVDSQLCRWPAERVTVLANPTDVRRLIPNLRRWARGTDDVLLVYFVGHGVIAPRGELCLAVSDTEIDEPDVTGIEYERVRSALLDSPARIKVVILDCCYSGRAIQALSGPADIAGITDVRGVYTITASDHAAHVPPLDQQAGACTSFTGELLDLIRTGIPGGPDTLTLNMIYSHLRTRLRRCQLPAPNQRGTDTVGEFGFTRNAALLPQPIERFPRPETPPAGRPGWRGRVIAAATAGALVAAAVLGTVELKGPGARAAPGPCSTGTPTSSSTAKRSVVVGSADFPESSLLGEIYAEALEAKGIAATTECNITPRAVLYQAMLNGQITIAPEYNGALLTTTVDPGSKAVTTGEVDAALKTKLPSGLAILDPAPAQDMDSVTVTQATATRYHLGSIEDLRRVAKNLVIGGPPEYQHSEQGMLGLQRKYGLTFKGFRALDDSGLITIAALQKGKVQVADVFTTTPGIKADGFVRLTDPRHVFVAENIIPLVYKTEINATVRITLNAVSAKLTMKDLLQMDTEVKHGENQFTVASAWLKQAGLG
jgi:glycine betaine/choline ABC-type transport system substrate-binding protein